MCRTHPPGAPDMVDGTMTIGGQLLAGGAPSGRMRLPGAAATQVASYEWFRRPFRAYGEMPRLAWNAVEISSRSSTGGTP